MRTSASLDIPQMFRASRQKIIRLEQQPSYKSDFTDAHYERWLNGDPAPPTENPGFSSWLRLVQEVTANGVDINRVRIHGNPPSEPQKWSRWKGRWNTAAGDKIHYLDQDLARELEIIPTVGPHDWWIFDKSLLLVLKFDSNGALVDHEQSVDITRIQLLLEWWQVAFDNSKSLETHERVNG